MPSLRGPFPALLVMASFACSRAADQPAASSQTPQEAVDELLAADRAFSTASADTDAVTGISAMFSDSVVMPLPGQGFAMGKSAAIEALRSNPANATSRARWTPIRGGISADGQHGFTFGYVVTERPDSGPVPGKYLAYWIREPQGWRVAVYKRARRPDGTVPENLLPPAIPERLTGPDHDPTLLAQHRTSLDSIERAFSDEAQRIGLGAAFAKYGSSDAVNMGGPDATQWVMGADSIGSNIGRGGPTDSSPVSWAPDRVLVASSGDLGVTIGMIRPNNPAGAGQPTGFPFFTIWRRSSPDAPWRYVAE